MPKVELMPKLGVAGLPTVGWPKPACPNGDLAGVVVVTAGWAEVTWGRLCCPLEFTATRPLYGFCCLIDSVCTNHQDDSIPSFVSTKSAGSGDEDSLISSSPGTGEITLSLLERSRHIPMGDVSFISSVMGSTALRESSAIVRVANVGTPSAVDCVINPISVEAVDAMINASFRCGSKSLIRAVNWYAGCLANPNGGLTSGNFLNSYWSGGFLVAI